MGWPRVHAECDYRQPLRFEDEVEIHLLIREKKTKSLSYVIKFRKLNGPAPVEVARGSLTVVCVTKQADGKFSAANIPRDFADQIQVAPAELLAAAAARTCLRLAAPIRLAGSMTPCPRVRCPARMAEIRGLGLAATQRRLPEAWPISPLSARDCISTFLPLPVRLYR